MMLAHVLREHPKLCSFHEAPPLLITEAYLRWSGRHDAEDVHDRLADARDTLIQQVERNGFVYVESAQFLAHLIPELHDRYGGRVVHLYRDGRDVVRSGLNKGWYAHGGPTTPFYIWLRRMTQLPIGNVWVDSRLDPPSELETRFEKGAWLWREINASIFRGRNGVPDDHIFDLQLERFGEDTLSDLLNFLGLSSEEAPIDNMLYVSEERPNRTEDHTFPPPSRWSGEKIERFWEIAGDMMAGLGYGEY